MPGLIKSSTQVDRIWRSIVEQPTQSWRRLKGRNRLPTIIDSVKFTDGIEVKEPAQFAA
jgi:hypothetical protein